MDKAHTNAFNKIIKKIYDNIGDIIKNIENFKEILEDFLESHPLINKFILWFNGG